MENLLIYIKHNFEFLWRAIETINIMLIKLLYRTKIENTLEKYKNNILVKDDFYVRVLKEGDLDVLFGMVSKLDSSLFKFFKPHKFDKISLENVLKNIGFVKLGCFDKSTDKLVGYFILSLFANKKCFTGRLLHPDYQGKGIARDMAKILFCIGKNIGFSIYSTISKENIASLNSLKAVNHFTIEKELNNGFVLIKYNLEKIEC